MDPILLAAVAALIIIVIAAVIFSRKPQEETIPEAQQQVRPPERQRNVPRRIQGNRNVRQRNRGIAPEPSDEDEEEESPNAAPDIEFPDKVGTKKRAKLEAKAEKKAQREFDERLREERKRTQEQNEAERQKEEERATLERKQQEEAERLAREEKERQEHEEYLKMKAAFSVEEEGFDEGDNEAENENLLQEFVNYVKSAKTVVMGDLAAKFKLKTQNVIDRIQDLLNDGTLTGVMDDRGKFIYVSETEMKAIVKFINQHGRLTVAELVENGDRLVHLKPSDELKT